MTADRIPSPAPEFYQLHPELKRLLEDRIRIRNQDDGGSSAQHVEGETDAGVQQSAEVFK